MYLPQPRQRPGIEENILPMINVVFLLLIFFMIAGALYKQDAFTVEPPTTAHTQAQAEPLSLVIAVAADGRLSLDGEDTSAGALVERIRDWQAANPSGNIRIKADSRMPATKLTALLDSLREAGVAEVRLLTLHEPS